MSGGGRVCPRHERFVPEGEECAWCEPLGFDEAYGPYRVLSRTRIEGGWRETRAYSARYGTVEYDVLDADAKADDGGGYLLPPEVARQLNRWCGDAALSVNGKPVGRVREIVYDEAAGIPLSPREPDEAAGPIARHEPAEPAVVTVELHGLATDDLVKRLREAWDDFLLENARRVLVARALDPFPVDPFGESPLRRIMRIASRPLPLSMLLTEV